MTEYQRRIETTVKRAGAVLITIAISFIISHAIAHWTLSMIPIQVSILRDLWLSFNR